MLKISTLVPATCVWNNHRSPKIGGWVGLWYLTPLSTTFELYRGAKNNGGGNRRKSSTYRKSLILIEIGARK